MMLVLGEPHRSQMATFAPANTGQFIIRPRSLRRRRTLVIMLAVLLVMLPYVAYEAGRARAGFSVIDAVSARLQQSSQIKSLNARVAQLQKQLSSMQLDQQMQVQASAAQQQSTDELQARLQQQQQDLAFYKAIVSPAADAPNAPRVQRLDIESTPVAQRYLLRLMLIQTMNASAQAQGTVTLSVSGEQDGRSVTLNLADLLAGTQSTSLPFAYKYFQTLEQAVQLPTDFEPGSVQIEVHGAQHDVVRQTFAWQAKPSV